jgi:hypothetical protein
MPKEPDKFEDYVERAIGELSAKPTTPPTPNKRYGYQVVGAKEYGYDDYFKGRPDVAGMALGGPNKLNRDERPDRVIVHNPHNESMLDPNKREALYKVEAARHLMDEQKDRPDFEITPEMQAWREKNFVKGKDPYATDDQAFKESIISRLIVNDDAPPVGASIADYANRVSQELERRDKANR